MRGVQTRTAQEKTWRGDRPRAGDETDVRARYSARRDSRQYQRRRTTPRRGRGQKERAPDWPWTRYACWTWNGNDAPNGCPFARTAPNALPAPRHGGTSSWVQAAWLPSRHALPASPRLCRPTTWVPTPTSMIVFDLEWQTPRKLRIVVSFITEYGPLLCMNLFPMTFLTFRASHRFTMGPYVGPLQRCGIKSLPDLQS